MKREIEYMSYSEDERLAMLENRAADLERMLSRVTPGHPASGHTAPRQDGGRYTRGQRGAGRTGVQHAEVEDVTAGAGQSGYLRSRRSTTGHGGSGYGAPADGGAAGDGARYRRSPGDGRARGSGRRTGEAHWAPGRPDARGGYRDWVPSGHRAPARGCDDPEAGYAEPDEDAEAGYAEPDEDAEAGYAEPDGDYAEPDGDYAEPDGGYEDSGGGYAGTGVYHVAGPPGYGAGFAGVEAGGYDGFFAPQEQDERTEVLINHGRRHARPGGFRRWARHWRAILISAAGLAVGVLVLAMILPGSSATWPASVAQVQREIAVACQNPNVVSEPSQVNFACGKNTRQILWVFSLLTSGDNPDFSDPANGRKGLEPITPAQGGSVAWSLNLHHPYNPANPTDSLEVAARAINNIIGGATLTGSNGAPVVQPGLESTPANCARYTGSSALVTRQGFPAVCAQPVTSPSGQAALVSDVFAQWMVGTPSRIAAEAGALFQNAGNPGDPRVQAILNSLPRSRL